MGKLYKILYKSKYLFNKSYYSILSLGEIINFKICHEFI